MLIARIGRAAAPALLAVAVLNGALYTLGPSWPPMASPNLRFPWIVPDPFLGWRNQPVDGMPFHIGADGYRVVPSASNGDDALTVLCLGDSGTFGVFRDDNNTIRYPTWPDALQARFNAAGIPARVINGGVIGYTAHNGLRQYRLYAGRVDVLILRFGWNDHEGRREMNAWPDAPAPWQSEFSRVPLTRTVCRVVDNTGGYGYVVPHATPAILPARYRRLLREMIADAQQNGAQVLVLDYPVNNATGDGPLPQSMLDRHAAYQVTGHEAAGPAWVRTGLTDAHFSRRDAVHPNAAGMDAIAAAVFDALTRYDAPHATNADAAAPDTTNPPRTP